MLSICLPIYMFRVRNLTQSTNSLYLQTRCFARGRRFTTRWNANISFYTMVLDIHIIVVFHLCCILVSLYHWWNNGNLGIWQSPKVLKCTGFVHLVPKRSCCYICHICTDSKLNWIRMSILICNGNWLYNVQYSDNLMSRHPKKSMGIKWHTVS